MPIRLACALLLSLALTQLSFAQNFPPPAELPPEPAAPLYQVEIMIFAYEDVDPNEERLNHRPPGEPDAPAVLERRPPPRFDDTNLESPLAVPPSQFDDTTALSPAADPFRFRVFSPEELTLTDKYLALERIPAYRPLVHGGWVQQALPENQARPFDLAMLGVLNPIGSIRLHLSRFLHLKVDLRYQTGARAVLPAEPAFGTTAQLDELDVIPRYTLATERQTRSGELHYFDHPAFGLLVLVTPVPTETTPVPPRPGEPAA